MLECPCSMKQICNVSQHKPNSISESKQTQSLMTLMCALCLKMHIGKKIGCFDLCQAQIDVISEVPRHETNERMSLFTTCVLDFLWDLTLSDLSVAEALHQTCLLCSIFLTFQLCTFECEHCLQTRIMHQETFSESVEIKGLQKTLKEILHPHWNCKQSTFHPVADWCCTKKPKCFNKNCQLHSIKISLTPSCPPTHRECTSPLSCAVEPPESPIIGTPKRILFCFLISGLGLFSFLKVVHRLAGN